MAESGPNVALVVLDTLRKDAYDRHFGWLDGTTYENAWSTTHYSPAAHGSLFTGRFGSEIGVYGNRPDLDCPEPTLAEMLRDADYTTRGFSANTYVSKYFKFDRGFETFRNETRVVGGEESSFNWPKFVKEHKDDGPGRYIDFFSEILASDADLFPTLKQGAKIKLEDWGIVPNDRTYEDGQKAVDYVDSAAFDASGEFLFINLMDAHGPYKAPPDYRTVEPVHISATELMLSDDPESIPRDDIVAAYDDCVRYLSDIYEQLHQRLAEDFDCIITLADHGEAFGEYGKWGHAGLGPEVTHVPISVHTTIDEIEPTPTEQPVNLHDVFQTVCDIANVKPPQETRGASLVTDDVREQRYKLLEMHGISEKKRQGLAERGYDQETIDQHDQQLHAIASKAGYAFEMSAESIKYVGERIPDAKSKMDAIASDIECREDAGTVEVPDEVRRRLEELGYA